LHIKPEKHNKVVSIPIGVSDQFKPLPENTRNLAGTNAMRKKRILWVGRPDPYKNLLGLVEAFARLLKDIKFPLELRLVGSRDMRYPEAGLRMRALGIENCVNQIGYVSDNELVEEYQNADVFILPSFYEGFGLPVVEAMACGTPVICSTNGALPEVVGNAALKVQPFDITGMAEALKRILTNETLAKDMRIKGLKRALKFRWQETARKTLEAYKLATL
jgi:glycosyltransferase involved in cell wall biosynthesis